MPSFEDKLREYARLLVDVGINLEKGQTLVINCQVDQAHMARLCADAAYERGAREVVLNWTDDYLTRAKFLHGDDAIFDECPEWRVRFLTDYARQGAGRLSLASGNPENMKGVDPDRLQRSSRASAEPLKEYMRLAMASAMPWCVGALASPSWAKVVFPDLPEKEAVEALWEKIFTAVRVKGDGTAVQAWKDHDARLQKHAEKLNEYRFDRLHYYNSLGTDYTVGLCKDHVWCAGGEKTPQGQYFVANMPTEEVFTAPDRMRGEGVLCASMPLCMSGHIIKDIRFEIHEGKIVKATASTGEDVLQRAITLDEGACRFGEVALVPYDSPIRQAETLFYNTLFDENAACHFAFGEAYPSCVVGATEWEEEKQKEHGLNMSSTHVDFMVGTADLSIDGIQADGTTIPVFRNGNFVF